jgi:hypothetical protein
MKLKEGEVKCSKCKGKGSILHGDPQKMDYNCGKCNGTGVTDWVTNAMVRNFSFIKPGVYTQEVDYSYMINPCAEVDLYYEGTKMLETTKDGFKIWGQKKIRGR